MLTIEVEQEIEASRFVLGIIITIQERACNYCSLFHRSTAVTSSKQWEAHDTECYDVGKSATPLHASPMAHAAMKSKPRRNTKEHIHVHLFYQAL